MDAWYSAMQSWQEQMNIISKSVDVSALKRWQERMGILSTSVDVSDLKRWQEQMSILSTSVDVSGIKRWQEQIDSISKAIDTSGFSKLQEQISGILHMIDIPMLKWQKEFSDLSKNIETSTLSRWQNAFREFNDLHNIIVEQGNNINDFEIDDKQSDNDFICNKEKLTNEEAIELGEDVKEIVDKALNSSVNRKSNIYTDIHKKYLKWEEKNPIKAGVFKIIISIIIENLIIFFWSAFSTNVKTLVPLIIHEDSTAKSDVVCTVPSNSEIEIYPIKIPYYYYIMYTDPVTGDIYDGCVFKRTTKFEKIEAVDEITLPASLY